MLGTTIYLEEQGAAYVNARVKREKGKDMEVAWIRNKREPLEHILANLTEEFDRSNPIPATRHERVQRNVEFIKYVGKHMPVGTVVKIVLRSKPENDNFRRMIRVLDPTDPEKNLMTPYDPAQHKDYLKRLILGVNPDFNVQGVHQVEDLVLEFDE